MLNLKTSKHTSPISSQSVIYSAFAKTYTSNAHGTL